MDIKRKRKSLAGKAFFAALLSACLCVAAPFPAWAAQPHSDVVLTSSDQQLISDLPPLKVAISSDFLPLEGYDESTNTYVGFVASLLQHISDQSGLRFEFVKTASQLEAKQLLEQGAVDMISGYDAGTKLLDTAGCSDIYLQASLLVVGKKSFQYSGGQVKIAITERTQYLNDELLKIYPGAEILLCHNTQDLFQAVETGKADMLVRNIYSIQSELAGEYADLAIIYDTNKLAEYRFAFSDGTNPQLISLINRYIAALPDIEKNQMLVTATLSNLKSIDMAQVLPFLIFAGVIIFAFLLSLLILVVQLQKKNLKIQGMLTLKKEYDEIIASRAILEGLFDKVYEMDITNDQALSPACLLIKNRLGLAEDCSYTEMVEAIAEQTVQEEYKALHRDAFKRENILKRYSKGETVHTIEVVRKQDFVHYTWNRITLCVFHSKVTDTVKAVVYAKNIQAEKDAEQKLITEADTDAMTGLYNNRSTQRMIDKIIEQSSRNTDFHALLLLDIDNFKNVNDTLGHSIGDEILKSIAGIIKSCFRERDVVSRIGGDEFLVFMKSCRSAETAKRRAREVLTLLSASYTSTAITLIPTLSIGIAFYPSHADNYTDLFTLADSALYAAKAAGRNTFCIFSDKKEMQSEVHNHNRQLQEAVVAATDGVAKYALNRGFRIFYCTERILSVMQLTAEGLPMGTDTAKFVHPDDRGRLYEELRGAYEQRRSEPFTSTYRIRKADGTYFKVKVNGFFTDDTYKDPDTGEEYPMFYLIFTNLSELRS